MDAYRDKNSSTYPHMHTLMLFWISIGSRVDTLSNRYPKYAMNRGWIP